jgi:hypothetical protein
LPPLVSLALSLPLQVTDWLRSGNCARIEPSNAFRLVLKIAKYTADVEYGLVEMVDQEHELWLDRSLGYSLAQFHEDVATKIIWGPNQTLAICILDSDTSSEWKIRRDDQ